MTIEIPQAIRGTQDIFEEAESFAFVVASKTLRTRLLAARLSK